ncbi:MAG: fasciclin domain-containing protein [Terricaulis sp.]
MLGALSLIAAPAFAAPTAVLVDAPQTPNPRGDVLDVAAAQGQFTHLLAAIHAAGYEDTLRQRGPYTLFAPTDAAFRQMDQHELARLMLPRNRDELRSTLGYHIVRGSVTSGTAHGAITHPQALNGYPLTVDGRDGLRVNDQLVAMQDVQASNGVIQGINSVLSPPVMVASL